MVLESLNELPKKEYVDRKKIIARVIEVIRFDGKELPEETLKGLKDLRDNLVGNDFSSLLMRYVGMNLLEDSVDEEGDPIDTLHKKIEELANQAIGDKSLLKPELGWLVTKEAAKVLALGTN
ncbi:MAG: hypothetical protein IBX64_01630 [Actinobacteria bacterium]|nr:hypothetical protein [Actinomycetota bacterium]